MAVNRWRLFDPYDTSATTREYVFPRNPSEMSSPFPSRNITSVPTTFGGILVREGRPEPKAWQFSGTIPDKAMYEALRSWVYERSSRLYLYDHFGRRLMVILESFDPTPKRAYGKYWYHSYTINARVLDIGAPTINEAGGRG